MAWLCRYCWEYASIEKKQLFLILKQFRSSVSYSNSKSDIFVIIKIFMIDIVKGNMYFGLVEIINEMQGS